MSLDPDAHYGPGRWHCDDLFDADAVPPCVRAFLTVARAPAHGRAVGGPPPLFASHKGQRVRVVMASRFGDVGITPDLAATRPYTLRVFLPDLTDFSEAP